MLQNARVTHEGSSGGGAHGVSARMRARLDEYGSFHTKLGNEICHFLGIPLIIAGAAVLLGCVSLFTLGGFRFSLTELVLLPITVFYVWEARALGALTALSMVALAEAARWLPFGVGLCLFLGGWVVQFVGHALYERRSPAFLGNLIHLLVGPVWLVMRAASREPKSQR